ncbi:type I-E CRISPR-associated protein Cas6/Cse3/CasE [Nonomuraea wenchangensis]|uniref:type I-E CRISPR-associated protein Cas6/Cse3/CasE n=1 Tax=Nonomuraea wenchangensis TaxID=568860 RepID=UPI003333C9FC
MFLSRLFIDPTSQHFRRDYADIQQMHRTVMSAFPDVDGDTPARQAHGVLWRLDPHDRGFLLYVQSHVRPDWSSLPAYYLAQPHQVRDLQPLFEAITGGRKFAFRLVANPTRAVPRSDKAQLQRAEAGKTQQPRRVALQTPESQIDWLVRQGERHGFVIPSGRNGRPDVAPHPALRTRGKTRTDSPVTIDHVRYDGHLIITDPARFTVAIRDGIGRAKAYGCGLISLAPAMI